MLSLKYGLCTANVQVITQFTVNRIHKRKQSFNSSIKNGRLNSDKANRDTLPYHCSLAAFVAEATWLQNFMQSSRQSAGQLTKWSKFHSYCGLSKSGASCGNCTASGAVEGFCWDVATAGCKQDNICNMCKLSESQAWTCATYSMTKSLHRSRTTEHNCGCTVEAHCSNL